MNKRSRNHLDKKQVVFNSPDLSKMQEVVIDNRTRIYIEPGADPDEARKHYLEKLAAR